jgi:hypothetical protein
MTPYPTIMLGLVTQDMQATVDLAAQNMQIVMVKSSQDSDHVLRIRLEMT